MDANPKTLEQIRREGIAVLDRELGPVGMIRFLQQFEFGRGDYTAERDAWLNRKTVAEILESSKQQ